MALFWLQYFPSSVEGFQRANVHTNPMKLEKTKQDTTFISGFIVFPLRRFQMSCPRPRGFDQGLVTGTSAAPIGRRWPSASA